jgi:hypothetical protein
MLGELGATYVKTLRKAYAKRVPGGADLVCYWFEKAKDAVKQGNVKRVGLVATNSIRGGKNRKVLDHVVETTRIFDAWSDEPWVNEGAALHVSLVCFGDSEQVSLLDNKPVPSITSSLTALVHHDIAKAKPLVANKSKSFQGVIPRAEVKKKQKKTLGLPDASFNLDGAAARAILRQPKSPAGEPMSDVVFPYWIGDDITTRPLDRFIVDFKERTEAQASMFEGPFAAIANVRLHREQMEEGKDKRNWWQLARWRPAMVRQLRGLQRYVVIPRVAKHHLCAWAPSIVVPDNALVVIAKDDDTTFGILQSRLHEVWALRMGTSLEDRPRYTPSTTFETFPFPEGMTPVIPAANYADEARAQRIAEAARALVEARDRWLNPPEWTDRVPEVVAGYPDRIIAKPEHAAELKKRTLTNLYNARPAWLDNLHRSLDEAVAAAYGWPWPLSDDDILRRLFELNLARAR